MRVAIIGSGISGISAAWALRQTCRTVIFEAGQTPGGHSNTIDVASGGQLWPVDTGFIVFNDRTYPGFVRFLRELGVESSPTSMSFSVRHDRDCVEYNGNNPRALFAQTRNVLRPGFWRMLRDIARLSRDCKAWLASPAGCEFHTLGDFLAGRRYSPELACWYLVPMVAAIWSASDRSALDMPFELFCRFFENHAFFDLGERPIWRTVVGGSRAYVRRALQLLEADLRLSCPIRAIRRPTSGGVEILTPQGPERFDAAIIACHSDTALKLLDAPLAIEQDLLSALPYDRNLAILHTDVSVMPRRRLAWAAWNSWIPADTRDADTPALLSYNMNILQGHAPRDGTQIMVSLNAQGRISRDRVIREIEYHHPRFTPAGFDAQARFGELPRHGPIFFAGAYWRNGFHEDGFWSGQRAGQLVLDAIRTGSLKAAAAAEEATFA